MRFYEFFAGGGMARLGLGPAWECLFANDIDQVKASSYRTNFGGAPELDVRDIADVRAESVPGQADLAWASFPCQDLSLAGGGTGLEGRRSGTFWSFWRLMRELAGEGRLPKTIVLENVYGAVTSHKGRDLAAICEALGREGFTFFPLVADALMFLPQSRPRLFIAAFSRQAPPLPELTGQGPCPDWHPDSFGLAFEQLSGQARSGWRWLRLPRPAPVKPTLASLVEDSPASVAWHSPFETKRLLDLMTPLHREKVARASASGRRMVGTVYRRTRPGPDGVKRQRAEVRFDDVAGCLRTPAGGSSRQVILCVDGANVRSRLLSAREAARLMGMPETYALPDRYNDAYRLAGDGVAVPVVSWLARNVLEPSLRAVTAEVAA